MYPVAHALHAPLVGGLAYPVLQLAHVVQPETPVAATPFAQLHGAGAGVCASVWPQSSASSASSAPAVRTGSQRGPPTAAGVVGGRDGGNGVGDSVAPPAIRQPLMAAAAGRSARAGGGAAGAAGGGAPPSIIGRARDRAGGAGAR
eukprot:SAG31_NODE_1841_length_7117_cov_12.976207_8_plen_146_part_00